MTAREFFPEGALTLEQWQRRPVYDRAFERFAYLLHEQL